MDDYCAALANNGSSPLTHDSIEHAEAIDEKWRWLAHSMDTGQHAFKRDICEFEQTSILYGEANGHLSISSKGASSTFSFIFVLMGALDLIDARKRKIQSVTAGTATSVIDHPGLRIKLQPGSSWVAYRVPVTTLRDYFERVMRRPYFQNLGFAPLYDFRTGSASALYQTLCHVSEDIGTATNANRPTLANVYERLLLAKLIITKPDNPTGANRTPEHRIKPRYVLRAESFVRENIHNAITIDEVAEVAGCSVRALQRMFKEYTDKSPMHVLCEYRLSAAHEAIVSGSIRNVSDLAMHFRFSSPGRFSSLYRQAYGMTPYTMMRFHEKST
ncbi:helix-turn-helix transcriptional regulator [Phyllobacterium sp. K27]